MALRELRGMFGRTVLVVLVVGVGAGTAAGIMLSLRDIRATRDAFYSGQHLADLDVRLTSPQRAADLRIHARSVGATRVQTRLVLDGSLLRGARRDRSAAEVVGMDPASRLNTLAVVDGRALSARAPGGAALDAEFASRAGVHVGDRLVVDVGGRSLDLTVRALVRSPEHLLATSNPEYLIPQPGSLAIVFVPLQGLQAMTANAGAANDLAVDLPRPPGPQELASLTRGLPVRQVIPRAEQFSLRFTEADLRSFSIFVPVLAAVFAVVGFLIVLLSMRQLVEARRRPLGALRAIGHPRRTIVAAVALPAVAIGVAGAVVAVGVMIGVARLVTNEYVHTVGFPEIHSMVPFDAVAAAVGLAVGSALAGVIGPALAVSRLVPAEAMRDPPARFHLPHWAERATATAGTSTTYVLRALFRRPLLTVATVGSIAVAIGLGAALNILLTSTDDSIHASFAQQRWDYSVAFTAPMDRTQAIALGHDAGAIQVQPFTKGFARISGSPGRSSDVELVAAAPRPRILGLNITDGRAPISGEIALSEQTLDALGRNVGQRVRVTSPTGSAQLEIAARVRTLAAHQGYVTPTTASSLGLGSAATGMLITGHRSVKRRLDARPTVGRVTSKTKARAAMHDLVRELTGLVNVLLLISLAVGALFLLSSLSLSFLERRGEFATLRAIGTDRRQLTAMVLGEGLVLAGLGALLSIPAGFALAWPLAHQIGQAWFRIGLHAQTSDFSLAMAGGLALAALAGLAIARSVQRIDVAAALRARFVG